MITSASEQSQGSNEQPKSFLDSIKPQPGDKTPCCRFVKALLKWIWSFLVTQRQLIVIVAIAGLTAWGICILWGWYWTGAVVFNPSYYYALPKKELLLIIAVGTLAVMVIIYALVMQHARSERMDCSLKKTHIDELAKLWLGEKQLKAQMEAANESWRKEQLAIVEAQAADRILVPRTKLVADFVQNDLAIFLPKFSAEEFKMLRFLLSHLEKSGLIPSVASIYQKDYDVRQFRYCNGSKDIAVTSDGKTSYEILAQTTLLDHSIRVTRNIIEEIKAKTNTYSILMPQAVLAALAHDIGKIQKFDSMAIRDNVATKNDHPYLSEMVLKETFPNYYAIDELTTVVKEHHLPVDKNSTMHAVALKEADKKARRQEMSAWFKRHYGGEPCPDPYVTVEDEGDVGDDKRKDRSGRQESKKDKNARRESQESGSEVTEIFSSLESGASDDDREAKRQESFNKIASTGKTELGDQLIPIEKEKVDYDLELESLSFDLNRFETALLNKIAAYPITIEQSKKSAFVNRLEIKVIPYGDMLLMSFATLLHIFRSVIADSMLEDDDYTKMAHYAIRQWRAEGVVVNVGTGYSVRRFEYYNDGLREQVALTPFLMDRLMNSPQERLEEAKQHPLFNQISNLTFARK
jgi:hypothetical protein